MNNSVGVVSHLHVVSDKQFWLLWSVICAFALLLAWPTLHYPWFYDDYHLIREFSSAELMQAFTGSWDVDGIENASYRPLWVLANHVRALLFGENMLLHHLFQLFTLALFTSLMAYAFLRIGLTFPYVVGAALFALATKSSYTNLMWLTDATHALSGIPVALCCVLATDKTQAFNKRQPLVIFSLALLGLLVREDIAALFPAVVIFSLIRQWQMHSQNQRTTDSLSTADVAKHTALAVVYLTLMPLVCSLIAYFVARKFFVPNAIEGFLFEGMLAHLRMTFWIMGSQISREIAISWSVFVAFLLGLSLLVRGSRSAALAAFLLWSMCVVLGCVPGLVQERCNLLMVPATLFAFVLAMALQVIVRSGVNKVLPILLLAGLVGFGGLSFRETRKTLLSAHPQSIETLQYTAEFLYGYYAETATIPSVRRAMAENYLRSYGITSKESYKALFPQLYAEAANNGRAPGSNNRLFVPPSSFLAL